MNEDIYKIREIDFVESAKKIILELIQSLQGEVINIALSGGSTPIPILKSLANENLNWNRINFFLVDERCVSLNNPQSNYNNINKAFFKNIDANSYSMVLEKETYSKAAANYEKVLKKYLPLVTGFPQFDLILLGMGDDGHTASLFPDTNALNENEKWVVLNKVPQLNAQRITLTFPVLYNSKNLLVLVKGKTKQAIIEKIYNGEENDFPICKIVQNYDNLKWIIGI